MTLTQLHTSHRNLPRHFWQWSINQLLKIDFIILHIKHRLPRAKTSFPKPYRAGGIIPVQRLNIQDL